MTTRTARRAAPSHQPTTIERLRPLVFAAVVVAVLTAGVYLAFGNFLSRPAAAAGTIGVQSSMAGFTPSEIRVKAGATVTFDWWTEDASIHLQGGVHTMIAPDLGLYAELPAESRRALSWTVPDKPGTYDVWCESCCGGKDNPQMHGKIVVEPAA
jgi:cytochrome c oxidase subunit II